MLSGASSLAPAGLGAPIEVQQVSLEVGHAEAALIAGLLESNEETAPLSVSIFEAGPSHFEVAALYMGVAPYEAIAGLVRRALGSEAVRNLRITRLPDADWVTLSQGQRGHVRAGRFTIHGSHEPMAAARGVIEVDASQAFGTAHHASTRGCLLALDGILKYRQPKCVIDVGTGTGVLAIAAAKESAAVVTATDNDPIAICIARENARKNGAPKVRFLVAQGFSHPALNDLRGDLVFGNLVKSILFELTPGFARHTAPGGLAVLSGITDDQAPSIEARFGAFGFAVKSRIRLDGWTSLVLCRLNTGKL